MPTINGISFGTVFDAVTDLGMDDTGGTIEDATLENALESTSDVLVEFPTGTYRFRDAWCLGIGVGGIRAKDGADVNFVWEDVSTIESDVGLLLRGDEVLLNGITFDFNNSDSNGPRTNLEIDDNLQMHDVTVEGYSYKAAVLVQIENATGSGVIDNLQMQDGHPNSTQGAGILVNQIGHDGSLTIQNSSIWHFNSGGIYASPNSLSGDMGPVIVDGCDLRNNNTASVRLGGTGSVVKNSTSRFDDGTDGGTVTWTDPIPSHNDGFKVPRHLQFRDDGVASSVVDIIGNLFKHETTTYTSLDGAIRLRGDYDGGARFENNDHLYDFDDEPMLYAEAGAGAVDFINDTIVGDGAENAPTLMRFIGRDNSTLDGVCIEMTGVQDGVLADNCVVDITDSNINVGGTPTETANGGSFGTTDFTTGGTCSISGAPSGGGGTTSPLGLLGSTVGHIEQTVAHIAQTVEASTTEPSSTVIIDDFEGSTPLANWQGDTGGFSIVSSPTYSGSASLRHDGDGTFDELWSVPGDGLPQYFPKGTRAEFYHQFAALENQWSIWWGVTDQNNCYRIEIEPGDDDMDFLSLNGGSASVLASTTDGTLGYQTDTWYRYEITRGDGATFGLSDNDIRVVVEEIPSGNILWDVTVNNSDHATAEGIGVRNGGPSADAFTDLIQITGGL